jgi:transcriptional regulator of heat shock response
VEAHKAKVCCQLTSSVIGSNGIIGEFSMEYKRHAPVLPNVQKEMEEEYRKAIGMKK